MSTVNNLTARESQTNLQPSELTKEETLGGDNSDRKPITGSDERNVTSFNVGFEESGSEVGGLQTAFKKFKQQKQMEIKQARKLKSHSLIEKSDPEEMGKLRNKFLKQAEDYFGVPYAKRYWKPTEPEYGAPLFLDCCGLVRQVLRDLQSEFGFRVGPWNQAYMYDTLPITLGSEEEMKPGDLVFIAATYYNEKAKRQKHDMVHVEIWAGDDIKTIGARWQRGKVQVFDDYKFEAKSYHSPTYIFKSIDTWLKGICTSHCSEHRWRTLSSYDPDKKSIFYQQQLEEGEDESAYTEPD